MILKYAVWFLQGMLVANTLLHAMVMIKPADAMAAQFGFMPGGLRIVIAVVYILCALGIAVPEFLKKPRLVAMFAGVLAAVAAAEAIYMFASDRSMSGMSRSIIVILLIVLAAVRMRASKPTS